MLKRLVMILEIAFEFSFLIFLHFFILLAKEMPNIGSMKDKDSEVNKYIICDPV